MFRVAYKNVSALGSKSINAQKRAYHGWLKKSIYVEENQGIRENSYQTWVIDSNTASRLLVYFIIPFALFYTTVQADLVS